MVLLDFEIQPACSFQSSTQASVFRKCCVCKIFFFLSSSQAVDDNIQAKAVVFL